MYNWEAEVKTSSAKAKGRRCAADAKDALLRHAPVLSDADVHVTSSGVTGPDLLFSPLASKIYPFTIECKNVERLNIWQALEQAESHKGLKGTIPLLIFTRNRGKTYVALELEYFLSLFFRVLEVHVGGH